MRRDQLLVLLSAVIIQGFRFSGGQEKAFKDMFNGRRGDVPRGRLSFTRMQRVQAVPVLSSLNSRSRWPSVISLQLEKLLVPSHSIRHTDVTLECHYKLEEETLYSVKWYKDGHEFYRYVPRNQPPAQVFNLQGVTVDLHNSTDYSVVLSAVQLSTSGRYRCEVSGEAPYFETVTDHANMMVVAPPKGGPEISGGQPRYHVGDWVNVTCSSKESKPAAQLNWMINGEPADPTYIDGPFVQSVGREGLKTASLELAFKAKAKHFKRGNMKLKCLATIETVYTNNNEKSYEGERPQKGLVLESRGTVAPSGSRADRVHTTGSAATPSRLTSSAIKMVITSWLCLRGLLLM